MPGFIRLKPSLDPVEAMIRAAHGAEPEEESGPRRFNPVFVGVGVLAGLSIVLALLAGHGPVIDRFLDSLRAFTDGFPGAGHPEDSAWLTLSKHMAAVAAFSGIVVLLYGIYRDAFERRRASTRRGHVVVCGLDEKGLRSARAFRAAGDEVTCIDVNGRSDAADEMRAHGAIVLAGDATERQTLKSARVDRAKAVVCAGENDSLNVAIAARVKELVPRRGQFGPVDVYAHIANPELARLLDARSLGIESIRLQFFNIYELWAQALTEAIALDEHVSADTPPHLLIAGSTELARTAVVWLARRWHSLHPAADHRLEITMIAEDASSQCALLSRRFPALERTVKLLSVEQPVNAARPIDLHSLASGATARLIAVCTCLSSDADNLTVALQARHALPASVSVILPESAWTGDFEALLLDPLDTDVGKQIKTIGYSPEPGSLDLLKFSRIEIMAREIHAEYLQGATSERAGKSWDELTNELRDSNRHQAHGIVRYLRAVWYELEPLYDWSAPIVKLSELEVEALAELEHLRWCDEKRRLGFVRGEPDDRVDARAHPDLVDWNELPDATREKNRRAVRGWPGLLARVGFGLERSSLREALGREIHERHVKNRLAAGETAATRPNLVSWEELTPEQRAPSLEAADDIGVKLARIGCELVPASIAGEEFSFTPAEVEYLAEIEHDRWCRQRQSTGWRLGATFDEGAKTHPDLVPWAELPEDRRQIDRDHVLELPGLAAAISRRIVRSTADDQ